MSKGLNDELLFFMDETRVLDPLPSSVSAQLHYADAKDGYEVSKSRIVIGRSGCDINLTDRKVSERHAVIGYFDGFFFLIDLDSKNHTFVNETKVTESVLQDGDTIRLGNTKLSFKQNGSVETSFSSEKASLNVDKILSVMFDERDHSLDDETRIMIVDSPSEVVASPRVEVGFSLKSGKKSAGNHHTFLQNEIVIGRKHGDLPLNDPDVSKKHASVEVFGAGQVFIKDLNSTNGTFVNEKRIKRTQIFSEDEVRVGNTTLIFSEGRELPQPEQPKAAAKKVKKSPPAKKKNAKGKTKSNDQNTSERVPIARFKVVSGMLIGRVFEATAGIWSVGGEGADIDLRDERLDATHAEVELNEDMIRIKKASGTEPIFVNGKQVESCAIDLGDTIRMGRTEFRIEPLADRKDSLTLMLKKAGVQVESKDT